MIIKILKYAFGILYQLNRKMNQQRESRNKPAEQHKWKRLIDIKQFTPHNFPIMDGNLVTMEYLEILGFSEPIMILKNIGLDMQMPPATITIKQITEMVGEDRLLDVLVVSDQSGTQMTLKEFQEYFDSPKRTRILNVITLEIDGTELAKMVQRPRIVRELDWTEVCWPRELKLFMDYPRVQLYCLMGVEYSFTDFHIDFGGSSVFYHVLWGQKIFYMIRPTKKNLQLYKKWSSSPNQADVFFGDFVDECYKVVVKQGNTMLIPSGWIHAVYTPMDTLVIGGNYLHSLAIAEQLEIAKIEVDTDVPYKFRFEY